MGKDPYELVNEFWGEDLSTSLIDRMELAPEAHIDAFEDHLLDHQTGIKHLPELARGHIRPVLTQSVNDITRGRANALQLGILAPGILLYFHELVLEDLTPFLVSDRPGERQAAGRLLIALRPLHEAGALHWRPVVSAKVHPAFASLYGPEDIGTKFTVSDEDWAYIEQLTERLQNPGVDPLLVRDGIVRALIVDASIHFQHRRLWQGRSHRLFRSGAEMRIFESLAASALKLDSQAKMMASLTSLSVPSLSDHVAALVAVRSNSDAFNAWRDGLANALSRLPLVEPHDERLVAEARTRLREELFPLSEGLDRESRRSAALSSLRTGMRGFAVSLIAGATGYYAGGNLASAAASAATSKALESTVTYGAIRHQQRNRQHLAELAVALTDEELDG